MLPVVRDLRHLVAYTLLATAFCDLYRGGPWIRLKLGYAFGLVPLLE